MGRDAVGGFMRTTNPGEEPIRFESGDRYTIGYSLSAGVTKGWATINDNRTGRIIAFIKDAPLATALKEFLNRASLLDHRGIAEAKKIPDGVEVEAIDEGGGRRRSWGWRYQMFGGFYVGHGYATRDEALNAGAADAKEAIESMKRREVEKP